MSVLRMFTIEERIGVDHARLRGLRYDAVRVDLTRRFRKPGPTNVIIHHLVNKFNRTGSVHDDTRLGRPSVPEGTVKRIQEAIERSPSASTRRLSRELEPPQSTVEELIIGKPVIMENCSIAACPLPISRNPFTILRFTSNGGLLDSFDGTRGLVNISLHTTWQFLHLVINL
ncbi:hypothetical protein C0J52_23970 [Blattella germanica]|nr:hypothetical protein C0J52_23970 [Blattella germanica]